MLHVNSFEQHIATRLLDFFHSATPWQRWLWSLGLVLTLKEVLQTSEAVHAGVLTQSALRNLAHAAMVLAGPDPGSGSPEQKRQLQQCLKTELKFEGIDYFTVRQIAEDIETNYLDRWAVALQEATKCPRPERCARAIASHFLDAGLSSDFLHRWWTFKLRHEKGERSLANIVADAHKLVRELPRRYEVLVAFHGVPQAETTKPPHFLTAPEVSHWLRTNGFDVSAIRQNGGIWIGVTAKDPWAAVEVALERLDRLASRVALGTDSRLTPLQSAWVVGEKRVFQLRRRRRGVEVHALSRENQLYSEAPMSIVDAAIELLGPVDSSSPSPAVAGAWAAIEALLSAPGDQERVTAGDRMAALVACSFPRAELTTLSYKIEVLEGPITSRLQLCRTNRDRSALLADSIRKGETLSFVEGSDQTALDRITALLAQPQRTLHDIRNHVAISLRRLYRQRNMVLHWGKTDAVALRASLRTSAPLVGAGMDRIAHAWFVERLPPLQLVARGTVRLETVGSNTGPSVVDLLD